MQALMLAAGMGRRLGRYTRNVTKCMLEVGNKTLIERAINALKLAGINKFCLVVGYESEVLIEYLDKNFPEMEFEYIHNKNYAETNNIYSLYMARKVLERDDTILLESDLIYEENIIREMVEAPEPNLVAAARYEQWMDGTVVLINSKKDILDFVEKNEFHYEDVDKYYKTVNIYKFSRDFAKQHYIPFLEAYIKAYGKNQYYETVLKAVAHIRKAKLKAFVLEKRDWYEIDDSQDLDIADTVFAPDDRILEAYEKHYGGYWRFPNVKDFCYLVNPYFPPEKMRNQMAYFFETLLTQYPSGMNIQKLNAGRIFQLEEEYILVGNGAAELINVLGHIMSGKMLLSLPAFNEYIRCFTGCEIKAIEMDEQDYQYKLENILAALDEVDNLVLINPDNPSGSFLSYEEVITILDRCKEKNIRCVIDESFIDFADREVRYTLIKQELLEKYPQLVVIKSISKSYGVPGVRLGIMVSADKKLMNRMRRNLSIWNINSYGEYFLQIYQHYKKQYTIACDKIAEQRNYMLEQLRTFPQLKVYGSQANYIMCKVNEKFTSRELAVRLIKNYHILIKNLSNKTGFDGESYIRIAVKDREENDSLLEALGKELKEGME